MDNVKISLPKPEDTKGAKKIKSFLRQLELCVHHLQKAVEDMEKDGEIDEENTFITYRHPLIDVDYDKFYEIIDNSKDQEIEIEIVTI